MTPTPDDCVHLSVEIVHEIHAEALKKFGGLEGIRDENLLASAVLAPQSSFGGKSPYADIVEVAAAYLFYICGNHIASPHSVDSPSAVAQSTETASTNAWSSAATVLDVAASKLDRAATTQRFRKLVKALRKR